VVPLGSTPINLEPGYIEAADPRWLKPKQDVLIVEGATFTDTDLILELPNDSSLPKKKIMFVLKVEPADPNVIGVTFYGKIYVEVE
jgi:hypothetical protein